MPTDATPAWPAANPRLWMLVSPGLPVGGFSYSQGLEQAVQLRWVASRADAESWIGGVARRLLPAVDLPYLARLYDALERQDADAFAHWNAELLASRDTSELRAEDAAMGEALTRLLDGLGLAGDGVPPMPRLAFAASFARACRAFAIPRQTACSAYAWVWCENQVAAAVKLVPLGQTEGQQMLLALADELETLVAGGLACEDEDLGFTVPGLAIASAAHETLYSRVFRS